MARTVTNTTPECHSGNVFDGKECLSPKRPACEAPAVLDYQGDCVTTVRPRCSDGSQFQDEKCITGNPRCSSGFKYLNGKCQSLETSHCDSGFHFVNGRCVRKSNRKDCGSGYYFQDGQCISSKEPNCPDGTIFNSKACVTNENPVCRDGSHLGGVDCVSDFTLKCQDGFKLHNNRCVSTGKLACPKGTKYVQDSRECVFTVNLVVVKSRFSRMAVVCWAMASASSTNSVPRDSPTKRALVTLTRVVLATSILIMVNLMRVALVMRVALATLTSTINKGIENSFGCYRLWEADNNQKGRCLTECRIAGITGICYRRFNKCAYHLIDSLCFYDVSILKNK